ncbi:MAG: hypothetical protein EOP48_02165 [Sphingobacteriales bacterium]|nr:MAG: hypothetical protein EOP48_02165 [Sphingobacteriales bacterium]
MKLITVFLFSLLICLTGQGQTSSLLPLIDTSLAKKISVSGFCLCQTSVNDLEKLTSDLKLVDVEEMDLPKNCYGQDARFENGKGYSSEDYRGIIFQKDQNTDYISKIRLTKDFKGNLPDGTPVDLQNLTLKDVFKAYPGLSEKWGSRDCSTFWNVGNDTISFFVKIDANKKPQYPVDEAYYIEMPIEAIDLKISCYSILNRANNNYKKLFNDPVFFIDSVNVTRVELQDYQPTDIALLTVYKDTNSIKLVGPQGRDGAVYIETKKFARNRYWRFFVRKSSEYLKVVPSPQSDSSVVYVLNGKVLTTNFEGELAGISDTSFIDLQVIHKAKLLTDYGINNKSVGIIIKANTKTESDNPK